MTDIDSLAAALFGSKRAESQEVLTDATTRTYVGTALTDSVDGTVFVDLGGDVTLPDDVEGLTEHSAEGIEVSTGPGVRAGDEVIVTLVGGTPLKTPMVTGVAGEGDDQDARIATASAAAEAAWDWADEAHTAASQAQDDAADAALSAAGAAASASDAASSASTASASAQQAVADASSAASAASSAQSSAANAEAAAQASAGSASAAATSASQAQTSAGEALTSAREAQASASSANAHATAALNSLATVEDVVDTLAWITEHGTMAKTTDTAVDPTKVYFQRDNSGDYVVGSYRYSIVQEPEASGLSGYYELTIDKSVQNYIATHLSLTNEGLWLTPTASNAYRVLVATGSGSTYTTAGTYIIDGSGVTVARFAGTGISFAQDRTFYIGDSDAFIFFDGDGGINIGGAVTIGGEATLQQLLDKYDATITSDDISVTKTGGTATITVGTDTVTIMDGAAGEDGAQILGITTAPSSYTTTTGGFTPTYRIALSTVKAQSGASEVRVGDILAYSYYHYPVGYVDASYVYCGARKSIRGAAGSGVTVSSVEYGTSASASTAPSSWSTTVPTSIANGQWLWVRTNYSDGTNAVTKSYEGTDGEDGTSVFVQSATKTGDTTTVVIADSEGRTSTLTIKDGEDGQNGTNGTDGLTGYVHTAWANSANGATDFSTTESANKKYLGVYTDNTAADSQRYQDYSWSLIKGADGTSVTVSSTATSYASSTSGTTIPTSGWQSTVPSVAQGSYLWTRVVTTFSDSNTATSYTASRQGANGTNGTNGTSVTVSSTAYAYQLSTSGTTVPTGTWQTTPQAPTTTQFAWTRTTTTYSDGSTAVTYTVGGKTGTNGTSYYAHVRYATDSSGANMSATPTSSTTYIGIYTGTSSTAPSSASSYTWSKYVGDKGDKGDTGPEAVVTVYPTAIDWEAGTATLAVTLRVDGTITTPSAYKWTKGTATTSLGTNSTLAVTDLNATYNCTVTW